MLGLLLASVSWTTAQVSVEVVVEQEQFLRDESLPVKVRITNRSGQTLRLGKEKDWLTFSVESRDGSVVSRQGEVPVEGEFSLESSQVATRRVDLMPHFDFSRLGRYTVTATVRIKQWNEEVISLPKDFDIVRGTKIWEQEFGVPTADGAPEARKYALLQANNLKQLKLYLRLTDLSDNKVFRVLSLGRLVSFSRPEAQVDKTSNLHVLFQTGPRAFSYSVINPDGQVVVQQTYDYTETRPVLRGREDGRILVVGGIRRPTPDDVLTPPPAKATNEVKTPKP